MNISIYQEKQAARLYGIFTIGYFVFHLINKSAIFDTHEVSLTQYFECIVENIYDNFLLKFTFSWALILWSEQLFQ